METPVLTVNSTLDELLVFLSRSDGPRDLQYKRVLQELEEDLAAKGVHNIYALYVLSVEVTSDPALRVNSKHLKALSEEYLRGAVLRSEYLLPCPGNEVRRFFIFSLHAQFF